MQTTTAKIISILFHPLLMPTIGMFLLFNTGTYLSYLPYDYQKILYVIIFLSTCVLPLIIIPVFIYRKFVKSMEMHNNNERIFPMLITLLFYSFAYYLFLKLPLPTPVKRYVLAIAITIAISLIVTIRWKISTHMIGIGGIVGVVAALSVLYMTNLQMILIISILLSGLIGFARLKLNAHTPAQIYTGFSLGFLTEFVMLVYFSGT